MIYSKQELNEEADKAEKPEDAAAMVKQYEDITLTKKKNIIFRAYHQGEAFKRFKGKFKRVWIIKSRWEKILLKLSLQLIMQQKHLETHFTANIAIFLKRI